MKARRQKRNTATATLAKLGMLFERGSEVVEFKPLAESVRLKDKIVSLTNIFKMTKQEFQPLAKSVDLARAVL